MNPQVFLQDKQQPKLIKLNIKLLSSKKFPLEVFEKKKKKPKNFILKN